MKLGIINTAIELQKDIEEQLKKIGLGIEIRYYGNFPIGFQTKERLKRHIAKAILDAFDENMDIILICSDRNIGKFDFLKEIGEGEILYFYERSIGDLKSALPAFVHDLTHHLDKKLYDKYEASGCGCHFCTGHSQLH